MLLHKSKIFPSSFRPFRRCSSLTAQLLSQQPASAPQHPQHDGGKTILDNSVSTNPHKISPSSSSSSSTTATTTASRPVLEDKHSRFHSYLRISLTERCNLRCQYCMPEHGVDLTPNGQLLSTDEIINIAKLFIKNGVNKIRLTGGEPLVRKDIEEVCHRLNELRPLGLNTLAMTTNGIKLKDKLPKMHLDQLNISLDTLVPAKFTLMTRRNGFERVIESIELALQMGHKPKINTVVMRGMNDGEIVDLAELGRSKPLEIRYIEYMPFDGNKWNMQKMVPYIDIIHKLEAHYNTKLNRLVGHPNDTSKTYQIPGFVGKIGFISSMSDHFCSSCNRLRITADGNLKVSLRDAIRNGCSEEELEELISAAVDRKKPKHAGMQTLAKMKNRPMITIGG